MAKLKEFRRFVTNVASKRELQCEKSAREIADRNPSWYIAEPRATDKYSSGELKALGLVGIWSTGDK